MGDGYVTLKTDQLPNAWSRESTSAEPRTPPAEYRRGSTQGQSSRASNPTQGQSKRFNSPDFKLPYTGKSSNMTSTPVARGYVNGDFSSSGNRGSRGGKSVRIASGNNRVYNGVEGDSLNGDYWYLNEYTCIIYFVILWYTLLADLTTKLYEFSQQ